MFFFYIGPRTVDDPDRTIQHGRIVKRTTGIISMIKIRNSWYKNTIKQFSNWVMTMVIGIIYSVCL